LYNIKIIIFFILIYNDDYFIGHLYLRVIWIISLVATSSYSYTWDVLMDWGFFQKNSKNKFLRDDLIFPTWVIIENYY